MSAAKPLDLRSLKETSKDVNPSKDIEPLIDRDHSFSVQYTSPDGVYHDEQLLSRILDGDERIDVARVAAKRAGVTWDNLPSAQAARIWAQSTIAVQLRDPPQWLAKWAMEDDSLLFACFEVCSVHEQEFFRNSDGESNEGTGKPRVSVTTTLAAIANG